MMRMMLLKAIFLVSLPYVRSIYNSIEDGAVQNNELDRPIPMEEAHGVLGKKKGLPCNISPAKRDDTVAMVLWFKETIGEPLYSYDVRGRTYKDAKLWSSPTVFGTRAYFWPLTNPATLVIDNIQLSDEGIYRCRVDFKNSPTRNSKVNFTVIVPPEKIHIYDDKRIDKVVLLGPYNEGTDVNLLCEVKGGRPRPRVIWFLENTVIDDSYENRSDGVVVNHLTFPNVGRQHLHARLICQASNNNIVPPESRAVVLDINLKPQTVNILTKEKHVSADKRYDVECRTSGSRPDAVITWWKGSRPVKRLAKNFSEQNNQSLSILTFVPVIDDDGKYLTCRAENPAIPDSALEDKWRLNVHYVPVVTLKMGSTLNPEDIKEGDDVYFECNIRANPKAYKLSWFHNNTEIFQNVTGGIILSDQSLVLQNVVKSTAGEYTCVATNSEGKGSSNPVKLVVRYAPVCIQEREELYGALKQETVTLRCSVDANPPVVTFHWTFNNSGDQLEVPSGRFTSEVTSSRLNYTPNTDLDYGTLLCYGENEIGKQKEPCVFQVVIAGRPSQLQNCSLLNQTTNSLQVDCTEGYDGGLTQTFYMEVLELPSLRSKLNLTSRAPVFTADGLDPGASYRIMLYAVNKKGRSEATVIDPVTFKGVAKLQGATATMPVSPLIMGLLGTAGILATGVCLVLAALCRKHYARPCHRPDTSGTKHVPMEAVINADDLIVDGSITGVRTSNSSSDHGITAEAIRNGNSIEATDPDIIRNQYERRPLHGFMKVYEYEPPGCREEDDPEDEGEGYAFKHVAKESIVPNQTIYRSLQRPNRTPSSGTLQVMSSSQTLTHKYRGPEVVTTSNRIQESCI
ncbi:neural cell adhesion molecule 1 isoform X2 [Cylas formicarius]|uniref:neural cell adhesion molecule 1 isoform X2 n=1 Tax=Cylas formicarius TaxID=197179 RepID=UPI0029583FDF|nr:neural cell adhesion molecule 1 isoform X2 [Cylas formicarius]